MFVKQCAFHILWSDLEYRQLLHKNVKRYPYRLHSISRAGGVTSEVHNRQNNNLSIKYFWLHPYMTIHTWPSTRDMYVNMDDVRKYQYSTNNRKMIDKKKKMSIPPKS